jgi:transketolase
LRLEKIDIKIINISTIKPFDEKSIIKEASSQKIIFSVEEHNVVGGIGSSIADVIATNGIGAKLIKIGLNDCFASGYGKHAEVKKINKLDSESIYTIIKENLK